MINLSPRLSNFNSLLERDFVRSVKVIRLSHIILFVRICVVSIMSALLFFVTMCIFY